jgi:alkylated DNA repair dioxygenase AlkB
LSFTLQLGLFGGEADMAVTPRFDRVTRTVLPGEEAWVEYLPGFVRGQERLFEALRTSVTFHQETRVMYEKSVTVPRLYAVLPEDGAIPPLLETARSILGERYGEAFERLSLGYYRDGGDSVAWHGDYVARNMPRAVVATISLGAPRAFHLRSKATGERRTWQLGWGDLFVMGGSCQRTWEHAVPKQKQAAPRIAVMFRPIWRER